MSGPSPTFCWVFATAFKSSLMIEIQNQRMETLPTQAARV